MEKVCAGGGAQTNGLTEIPSPANDSTADRRKGMSCTASATRRYPAAPLSQLACDSEQERDTVWWFRTVSALHDTLMHSARRRGKRRKTAM